jgi:hypothetical protein
MLVTGKNLNDAGEAVRDLLRAHPELQNEAQDTILYFKFPGRGQQQIPTAKVDVVIQVVMLLPGAAAAAGRVPFSRLIRRYVAGDQTMLAELNNNRAAQDIIAQIPEDQRSATQQLATRCLPVTSIMSSGASESLVPDVTPVPLPGLLNELEDVFGRSSPCVCCMKINGGSGVIDTNLVAFLIVASMWL